LHIYTLELILVDVDRLKSLREQEMTTIEIQDKYLAATSKINHTTRDGQESARDERGLAVARLIGQCGMTYSQALVAVKDADDMYFLEAGASRK